MLLDCVTRTVCFIPLSTLAINLQYSNCIPIEIILEQRCAKFIWSRLYSTNTIIKIIALSAISSVNSTFDDIDNYM